MTGRLEGKVTIVTGAGSGIGRAAALALAREGARLSLSDVNDAGGNETLEAVRAAGVDAIYTRADVSRAADVDAMVAATVDHFGRLDRAFNNAGVEGLLVPVDEYPEEEFDRLIAINVKGVYLCLKAEIPRMKAGGGGAIVNNASIAGLIGAARFATYCASKHAVVGYTKAAAIEAARDGVRINAVCPGLIQTPMLDRLAEQVPEAAALIEATPMGRTGTPEEIAEAVVWLCSDAASFVTGFPMAVDGGYVSQ